MSFDWKKRSSKGYGRKISTIDKMRACEMLSQIKANEMAGKNSSIEPSSMPADANSQDQELSEYERIRLKNINEKQNMLTAMQDASKSVKIEMKLESSTSVQCDQCNYIAANNTKMEDHKRACHGGKLACKICGYQTAYQARLSKHVRFDHPNSEYATNFNTYTN